MLHSALFQDLLMPIAPMKMTAPKMPASSQATAAFNVYVKVRHTTSFLFLVRLTMKREAMIQVQSLKYYLKPQ